MGRNEQNARAQFLMRALSTTTGVRIADFAKRAGLHERTVRRDLQGLEQSGLPISEVESGCYRLDSTARLSPTPPLLPNELLAIGAARASAKGWSKTKLGRALETAWCKLSAQGLDATQPSPPARRSHKSTAVPGAAVTTRAGAESGAQSTAQSTAESGPEADLATRNALPSLSFGEHLGIDYGRFQRTIATIESAIERRVAIACRYRRIRGGQESERIIEPSALHVDPALDSLYLIAFCRLRNAVRVFAVHRFISAHVVDSAAPRRPELRTKAALQGAFRVWRDETVSQVHLRFFGDITTHVAERTVHKSQRIQWNVPVAPTLAATPPTLAAPPPTLAAVSPTLASTLASTQASTQAVTRAATRAADRSPASMALAAATNSSISAHSTPTAFPSPPATASSPTLDIHFEVAGTQEVLHWLLGYGAAVQVLAPLSLIEAHKRELSGGLARYPAVHLQQPTEYQPVSQPITSPALAASEKTKTLRKPRTSVVRGRS